LEIVLIVICMALCVLLYRVGAYRMVVMNLFYLPIVLAAFFLGRYRAGILALFCVMSASVVVALNLSTFVVYSSPLVMGLALTIWGAVMGINAILVGTLSDESAKRIEELHDAYVGVVEVLGRYLSSADPKIKSQTLGISELAQQVAAKMRLSDVQIDNIRVAALLQDIQSIEVTARVIQKAMGDLAQSGGKDRLEYTFHGNDLVQSLGSVLTGALPLLIEQGGRLNLGDENDPIPAAAEPAIGSGILHTVRKYLALASQEPYKSDFRAAINYLKNDLDGDHHPAVIHALAQVLIPAVKSPPPRELVEA
jgi:hypothetical protein